MQAVCQGTCCREIIPLCRCSIFLRVRTQARTCTYYARRPWPPLVSWRTKGTGELSDCVHIWCHGPQIDLNTYSVLQRGLSHASRPTTGFTSDRCIENIGGATGYMIWVWHSLPRNFRHLYYNKKGSTSLCNSLTHLSPDAIPMRFYKIGLADWRHDTLCTTNMYLIQV